MRSFAKAFVENLLARRRSRLRGCFRTFDEAKKAAGGEDYEDSGIAELVARKTRALGERIEVRGAVDLADDVALLMLFSILRSKEHDRPVRFLDFGGACGAHFLLARSLLGGRKTLEWAVVETPTMVGAAQIGFGGGIRFFASLAESIQVLGRPDVVFANNAIQYARDPLRTLSQLLEIGAESVCLCKVPCGSNLEPFFTIQTSHLSDNGPGSVPIDYRDRMVSYPLAILPASTVEAASAESYRLAVQYEHASMLYHPAAGLVRYCSFVLTRSVAN